MITNAHLQKSITYTAYRAMIDQLMLENKTTGPNQSEELTEYAKLNIHRMNRLDKTVQLSTELITTLQQLQRDLTWVVLTEGWCGDAAQNVPVLHTIAQQQPRIQLRLLLRDENLDIMDQYLTNGGRSIPKLICLDTLTMEELFTWGPRPAEAQTLVQQLKAEGVTDHHALAEKIHAWYAQNKTTALQLEIQQLLEKLR